MKRIDITIRKENFVEKLEALKKIYSIKSNSKLIEHIVELELQRFGINSFYEVYK